MGLRTGLEDSLKRLEDRCNELKDNTDAFHVGMFLGLDYAINLIKIDLKADENNL